MIIKAEVISQPLSGAYDEVIFDYSSSFKSSYWGWIKFTNDDYTEWIGEFRGQAIGVEISEKFNNVLILTSDCLYMLDRKTHKVIEMKDDLDFNQITLSTKDEYILGSSYDIGIIKDSLERIKYIESLSGLCCIKFEKWQDDKLLFSCEDYGEGDFLNLTFDGNTYEIEN
ncbi:MAG: hypothetical protein PUE01_12455 [Clostridiaceae bacterium]|nr:hypothetical protein [Clostridiaceae bacterium]